MTGPSLVLSQALGLWDAQLITLSFKSFTSHSAAVIELRCGSRTNTTLTGCVAMSIHAQNCKYSKQVLLDYILRHDFRPHKLLFIPHNTILWCYKQSVQPAARTTQQPHTSQTWTHFCPFSSWRCEVFSFTTLVTGGNFGRNAWATQSNKWKSLLRYDFLMSFDFFCDLVDWKEAAGMTNVSE